VCKLIALGRLGVCRAARSLSAAEPTGRESRAHSGPLTPHELALGEAFCVNLRDRLAGATVADLRAARHRLRHGKPLGATLGSVVLLVEVAIVLSAAIPPVAAVDITLGIRARHSERRRATHAYADDRNGASVESGRTGRTAARLRRLDPGISVTRRVAALRRCDATVEDGPYESRSGPP
jgi:hypothetical protein